MSCWTSAGDGLMAGGRPAIRKALTILPLLDHAVKGFVMAGGWQTSHQVNSLVGDSGTAMPKEKPSRADCNV